MFRINEFLVAIWQLVTPSCAGRKYQIIADRQLSICCSTVSVEQLWSFVCCVRMRMSTCLYTVCTITLAPNQLNAPFCVQAGAEHFLRIFNTKADANFSSRPKKSFSMTYYEQHTNKTLKCYIFTRDIISMRGQNQKKQSLIYAEILKHWNCYNDTQQMSTCFKPHAPRL